MAPASVNKLALVLMMAAASWYAMMLVHELGHAAAAAAAGAKIESVTVPLLGFSQTRFTAARHETLIVWAGPAAGALLPLAAFALHRALGGRLLFLSRFFAGFCLIANGVYLASALAQPVGDAEDLVRLGTARWVPGAIGCAGLACGLAFWSGLRCDFAPRQGNVEPAAVRAAAIFLGLTLTAVAALRFLA